METLRDLLKQGLEFERQAYRFYVEHHGLLSHPGARIMVMELAAEEMRHIELFDRALQGQPVEFGLEQPEPKQDLGLAQRLSTPVLEEHSDPSDVLIVAMKLEWAAIQRYDKWAVEHAGNILGQLAHHLAAEERAHKYRLEKLYDDEFLSKQN